MEERPSIDDLLLSDYDYDLPSSHIALHPAEPRDHARLLVYRGGTIRHQRFDALPDNLPPDSLLVFNDTRVIRARLYMRRDSGAQIEILLLRPVDPVDIQQAMQAQGTCSWSCMIGRKKKWKSGEVLSLSLTHEGQPVELQATLADAAQNIVRFAWQPAAIDWAALVAAIGTLPLPPYFHRAATADDLERYQTVYARHDGAVAAPTAGLHFTPAVLARLAAQGIASLHVTLHTGAGTFLPVKTDHVAQHDMHAEQMVVDREQLRRLLAHPQRIAVGTTSMRLLESLYWLGVLLYRTPAACQPDQPFFLPKLAPYAYDAAGLPSADTALQALIGWMEQHAIGRWIGDTQLLILPGYTFRLCRGLITNYHLPQSTLILLVAAFVGPAWRGIYEEALAQGYRFLSYGDSSLLLP
ncbi:MAG: S-adenosylmethionine:tRNA ribosyltransferase-isomerase [Bacteroidia bacterium]